MTRRPWMVALLLAAGAMALIYNAKVYSELLAEPNSTSDASAPRQLADEGGHAEETAPSPDDAGAPAPELAPLEQAALDAYLGGVPSDDRDPFRFASEERAVGVALEPASQTPSVEGVLIGAGRRVAFIDGRARSEGEEVAGHVIVRIEPERVVLAFQGREIEVPAPR